MTCKPMDVVVVPFPFTARDTTKRRPALVVSSAEFNERHAQTVLAMITSAKGSVWPSDVALVNWRAAGLAVACSVRLKLFTLDNALIIRGCGSLSAGDAEAVRTILAVSLEVRA